MCTKVYDTYPCNIEDVKIHQNVESYEIPNHDGARISKYAPPGKLLRCYYDDATTLIEMMERGCRLSGNGPCVGWRSSNTEYSWITYKEFMTRAKNFGSGITKLIELGQTNCISIYAQNSIQWLVAQYGCFYHSSPVVPLYDSIGPDSRNYMINNAETQVVVCDVEKKVKALLENSGKTPALKHIIFMDDISNEIKELGAKKSISLHLFKDIEEYGSKYCAAIKLPNPSDAALICYTSGTTGDPKGAILKHKNIISGICGTIDVMGNLLPHKDDIHISFLPLAHVYEQLIQVLIFLHGGRVGFYSGDVSQLTDDMKVLQPTIFAAVPRVLNKIYDKVEAMFKNVRNNGKANGVHNENGCNESQGHEEKETTLDPQIYKPVLDSMGGKLRLIFCGAAPISEKILNFYHLTLGCKVLEVYGQTECAGPCAVNPVSPETVGSVGPPLPCCMIKLEDVPELGYFKENGIGEVCVKGPNVFDGYFKNPEKTSETLDENGWLRTGDVGMWLPNGYIKIVDRKKHIFKLAQGEYILPEKIENIYLTSQYVSQILVHGDSLQSFLVAVVIPEKIEVLAWCKENNISGKWEDMCRNSMVIEHILEDMQRTAKAGGLLSFQQVKRIHLHPKALTTEDGHLTPTLKTKRNIVRKLFMDEIHNMYNLPVIS